MIKTKRKIKEKGTVRKQSSPPPAAQTAKPKHQSKIATHRPAPSARSGDPASAPRARVDLLRARAPKPVRRRPVFPHMLIRFAAPTRLWPSLDPRHATVQYPKIWADPFPALRTVPPFHLPSSINFLINSSLILFNSFSFFSFFFLILFLFIFIILINQKLFLDYK